MVKYSRMATYGALVITALVLVATLLHAARVSSTADATRQPLRVADRVQIVASRTEGNRFSADLLSLKYCLDRVYPSMSGPRGNHSAIRLIKGLPDDELLWITGIESHVVDAQSSSPVSNEFFCHSNLTLCPDTTTPEQHNASLQGKSLDGGSHAEWRLFTLIPGRMSIELPEGFGVPIKNGTLVDYFTMALNQNPGMIEREVRIRTKIRGRLAREAKLRPLFRRALYIYQQHAAEPAAGQQLFTRSMLGHQGDMCGEDCDQLQLGLTPSTFRSLALAQSRGANGESHPGETCCVENASSDGILERFGEQNTIHWYVPPGRHTYRTEVTAQCNLPFDTTVHYATGHLHPFGTSLKLVDLDGGQTLVEITGASYSTKLGVEQMSEVRSTTGLPLAKGGRYELIAEYDNPLPVAIDAMAILYLYALDLPPTESRAEQVAGY